MLSLPVCSRIGQWQRFNIFSACWHPGESHIKPTTIPVGPWSLNIRCRSPGEGDSSEHDAVYGFIRGYLSDCVVMSVCLSSHVYTISLVFGVLGHVILTKKALYALACVVV